MNPDSNDIHSLAPAFKPGLRVSTHVLGALALTISLKTQFEKPKPIQYEFYLFRKDVY